ncbi:MAG TPA: energy coupling factor transporter S component ThiW [Nitrososphaeria archaeon]|nr:MAG: energy coupling factor transporter S component ThiW [Candidatus Wolframiiraptor sp.]HDD39795.1 energy coupling factor transporter S component ThiW [Nitrososphaeria archaeon]
MLASKKISLVTVFTALGVAIAPVAWFPFISTKAYPGQHLINALAGVMLGPWWAMITAILIGIIRNFLGIGTIYAFPGGLPGAIVVGLSYILTSRLRHRLLRYSAALLEPIGTVIIGGTLSLFIVAPAVGDLRLLGAIEQYGAYQFLLIFWSGWAISSVPGSVFGYVVLLVLDKTGILQQISAYRVSPRATRISRS